MSHSDAVPVGTAGKVSRRAGTAVYARTLAERTLTSCLDAIPDVAVVLNGERRIVIANRAMLRAFEQETDECLRGWRPNDVPACVRARNGADGCGSARCCCVCGAVEAVWASQDSGPKSKREWRITVGDGLRAREYLVVASPLHLDDQSLTLCIVRDVTHEKQEELLERVFFHDLLNTVSGLVGLAHLLEMSAQKMDAESQEFVRLMVECSEELAEEIKYQRKLLEAERGTLRPEVAPTRVRELLERLRSHHDIQSGAQGKRLALGNCPDVVLQTDAVLLRHILTNLVKNALEATASGETVTVECTDAGDMLVFAVHNPGGIPDEVQRELFQRRFTTRGHGRGIGTYGARLLGEGYLGGRLAFESQPANGTTVYFTIPKEPLTAAKP